MYNDGWLFFISLDSDNIDVTVTHFVDAFNNGMPSEYNAASVFF